MKNKFKIALATFLLAGSITGTAVANIENPIQLLVDGENITEYSSPVIESGRTLVPVKFIVEELGGKVTWDGVKRTVLIEKDDITLLLWIDSNLVKYNDGESYVLSDVAPKIINDRTYVPLRLISNAFSVGIKWDQDTRSVIVDSSEKSVVEPFFDVDITSHKNRDIITENTSIKINASKYKDLAKEIKVLLLDPDTAKGFVVSSSSSVSDSLNYSPRVNEKGDKVLVVGLYDENRKLIGGDVIAVNINVTPKIDVTGIEDKLYYSNVTIKQNVNFNAEYVSYKIINTETEKVVSVNERDPLGSYTFYPSSGGNYEVQVSAYDRAGVEYKSSSKYVNFSIAEYMTLSGVSNNKTISGSVSLIANRNFDVRETEYFMIDKETGKEEVIANIPWGSYNWSPTEKDQGEKQLFVRVIDSKGELRTSPPVEVKIDFTPKLYLKGVGPKQVLTSDAKLSVSSNVDVDSVSYTLENKTTGSKRDLSSNMLKSETYNFSPSSSDAGDVTIQAKASFEGKTIYSDKVSFNIYLGNLYGPKAVVEKDKFLPLISNLAIKSFHETGMAPSIQMAQAILETGWGQSVPVDKYTGKFSYNLFGIKGSATNGSVTSNTWEVYNGVTFRVDANFRAYNNINEGWNGHKDILLKLSRYEQFRDVMYDSTLAAYAVRRAGYATDPKYPMKLLKIIKKYELEKLDEVGVNLK